MRRNILIILAVLLLAVIGTGSYVFWSGQGRPQYRTAPLERSTIVATISATGNLNPVISVQVGSQISGMVSELHADFNSEVKKGQLLARIDPQTYEAQLRQAQADLDNAKAGVLNAQRSVAQAEANVAAARANVVQADVKMRDAKTQSEARAQLFQQGAISQEERDTAQANFDAADAFLDASRAAERAARASLTVTEAQLDAARAQMALKQAALVQAQVNLAYTYIRAPVDGTVVSRNVDVGQTVAASLQAPTLFIIGRDLTKMQVDTNVDEADVGRVVLDQPVNFTVDSYPGQTFRGRVVQIRQSPQIVQNVVTYDVVVAVDNPDLKLKPGMTANVRILVARKENVLVVSNAAFRVRLQPPGAPGGDGGPAKRPPAAGPGGPGSAGAGARGLAGTAQKLWVLKGDKPDERTVRTGLTDGQRTEVVEGLTEGEPVIVAIGRAGGTGQAPRAGGPGLRF